MKRICIGALGLGLLVLASPAKAINVDFEGPPQGSPVEFAGFGIGIFAVTAVGNSGASIATVLNTEGSSNPNARYPYSGGNLRTSRLRKVLIVPSQDGGTTPDPAGGQLTLTFFERGITTFGFDVLDVDVADAPNTFITFRLGGTDVATIPFSEFKNSNSPFKRTTVSWGNNTANRVAPFTAREFGVDFFDEVVFDFPTELAIDNINYRTQIIPEPTAVGLMIGLPALASLRRRRRK